MSTIKSNNVDITYRFRRENDGTFTGEIDNEEVNFSVVGVYNKDSGYAVIRQHNGSNEGALIAIKWETATVVRTF